MTQTTFNEGKTIIDQPKNKGKLFDKRIAIDWCTVGIIFVYHEI